MTLANEQINENKFHAIHSFLIYYLQVNVLCQLFLARFRIFIEVSYQSHLINFDFVENRDKLGPPIKKSIFFHVCKVYTVLSSVQTPTRKSWNPIKICIRQIGTK